MNVNFDGRTYSFEVKPGPDGYKLFTEAIRRAFSLPDDSELNITFTCDEPTTVPDAGSLLTLQGAGAYDAAVHCASVSAARRMTTPTPSRTVSGASEMLRTAPQTPRSPIGLGLAHHNFETPSPHDSTGMAISPESGSGASISRGDDGRPGSSGKRRLSGFGRKIRTALNDLLSTRQ